MKTSTLRGISVSLSLSSLGSLSLSLSPPHRGDDGDCILRAAALSSIRD